MYVGLDLGQATDYTALAILEQRTEPTGLRSWLPQWNPEAEPRTTQETATRYEVRHLDRWLGVPYPEQVSRVGVILRRPELDGAVFVIDGTGVGRAVVDMFRAAGHHPIAVSIHGGDAVTHTGDDWRVPKRDLAATVAVLLQARRLRIAKALPHAQTLTAELANFKVTIDPKTAHDSYAAWREAAHDDMVLATALAAWAGETGVGAPAHVWWA